jgi:hypothetical protein
VEALSPIVVLEKRTQCLLAADGLLFVGVLFAQFTEEGTQTLVHELRGEPVEALVGHRASRRCPSSMMDAVVPENADLVTACASRAAGRGV